ncbi:MAG: PTS sugar transporter subunit IIA [Deltaproteobacteria bacterium]|nr:MAG: PTS sugar transporter subunit IIA [Deltaproteobacteria bacterium]
MKLSEIIEQDDIIPELQAEDKAGVLEELAEVICRHEPLLNKKRLVQVLMDRERLGTTGIGDGIAIPHGKIDVLKTPLLSFGRSKKGINYNAIDNKPVHLFFLLVAPENSSGLHLHILARIARLLKNNKFKKGLMEADTEEEIYKIITEADKEISL